MANCVNCKLHKKGCKNWQGGECEKCRNAGIVCVPYAPKRRGRPPGKKDTKPRKTAAVKKHQRADVEMAGDQEDGTESFEDSHNGEDVEDEIVESGDEEAIPPVSEGQAEKTHEEEDGTKSFEESHDGEDEQDDIVESSDEEPTPPITKGQPVKTYEEEMGEDTRFSTLTGYYERTIAAGDGLWKFDRVAVGRGGKGGGAGKFMPTPSDGSAGSAAVDAAFKEIQAREVASSPPKSELVLSQKNGKVVLRGSARRAAEKARIVLEREYLNNGPAISTPDESDDEFETPPLKGFPDDIKLAWSGRSGSADQTEGALP